MASDYTDLLAATGWAAPAVGSMVAWARQLRSSTSGRGDATRSDRTIAGGSAEWTAVACAAASGLLAGVQGAARPEVVSLLAAVTLFAAAAWRATRLNRPGSTVIDRIAVASAEVAVVVLAWVSICLFLHPDVFPSWWLVTAPLSTVVAAVAVLTWSRAPQVEAGAL